MKNQISFLISIGILCCSCNSSSSDKTKDADSLSAITSAMAGESLVEDSVDLSVKNDDEIGFELLKSESIGDLKIGLSALKTKELIGAPAERSKAEKWEADGEVHQNWLYTKEGITLEMVGEGDQMINSISIIAPCKFKTKKQIGIGSSKDEVLKAYNVAIDGSAGESDNITVGTVYGGLMFNFENGKVNSVFIGSSAE